MNVLASVFQFCDICFNVSFCTDDSSVMYVLMSVKYSMQKGIAKGVELSSVTTQL